MGEEEDRIIQLKIKNKLFKCGKGKLISSSDYFKAMFSSSFIESNKEFLELKDVDPDAMKHILAFIIDGSSNFLENTSTSIPVLQCASMLQFCTIQKICEDHLIQNLSPRNCLEIYQETYKFANIRVSKAALTFSFWWFEELIERDFFLNLSLENVIDFLKSPELNLGILGEWVVWEAILKWIHHKEEERTPFIFSALQCLDFTGLSDDDLSSMMFYDVISGDSLATMFLERIMYYRKRNIKKQILSTDDSRQMNSDEKEVNDMALKIVKQTKLRMDPQVPCIACYKKRTGNAIKGSEIFPVVLYYDIAQNKLEEMVELTKLDHSYENCIGFRVCAIGPYIYITGGQYIIGGNQWNNDFWSYNSITDKWKVHAPLPQRRRNHMVCVFDSVIYLIGGYGKHRISLSSVDAYDTKSEQWISCPDIPFSGVGALCTFKGRILVFINGHLFSYYPERKFWASAELKCGDQKSFSVAMPCGNTVYLVGSYSRDVYRIKPDTNNIVEFFGSFKNNTENVCLVAPRLISFTTEDDGIEENSDKVRIVEILFVAEEDNEEKNDNYAKDENKMNNSSDEECALNLPYNHSRLGTVVWKEEANDTHSVSNASNFYGCFTLFKINKDKGFL